MTVASKIAGVSALHITLLAGLLIYHVSMVQRSVAVSHDLSENKFRTSTLLREQIRILSELEKNLQKYRVTGDDDYLDKVRELNHSFEGAFAELRSLELSVDERRETTHLATMWAAYWRSAAPAPLRPATDRAQAIDVGPVGPGYLMAFEPPWLTRQASAIDFAHLQAQASRAMDATQKAIAERLVASAAKSREAERVSLAMGGTALGLSLLIVYVAVRSIHEPLKRLTFGIQAVTSGQFSYQIAPDSSQGDEFSRLADAFNAMVSRLGELDEMKKDFVAHVSHELKNPLVAMQETNQLLVEQIPGALNAQQLRLLELNVESGKRLSAMLSRLLDLSRMEAGAMAYEFKTADIGELLWEVVGEFEARARERRIRLALELPVPGNTVYAPCDRDRLIQVVENILDNSIKYSPQKGEVCVRVEVLRSPPPQMPPMLRRRVMTAARGLGFAQISVADQGPGVPDGEKQRIFRKFHQTGQKRRATREGVGLGLAICREIVAAHHGAIWVTDNGERGSLFHVLLPGAAHVEAKPPKPAAKVAREGYA